MLKLTKPTFMLNICLNQKKNNLLKIKKILIQSIMESFVPRLVATGKQFKYEINYLFLFYHSI